MPSLSTRVLPTSLAATLWVAASPLTAEVTDSATSGQSTAGAVKLAQLLEGRQAGEPVRCIRVVPNIPIVAIDKTAYVFGSGSTLYLQRTNDPSGIRSNRALAVRRYEASQMCKLDPTRIVDPLFGFVATNVLFEDFIPYTRVDPRP